MPASSSTETPTADQERLRIIEAMIEEVRPMVRQDGGEITLASVKGDIVRIHLDGNCRACSLAAQTLGGLRRKIMAALGEPVRVLPALSDN